MSDLRVRRGDTATISITARKRDGITPQSLAGFTLRFTAKDRHSDADADAIISKVSPGGGITIDDAAGGLATVTLDAADTAGFTERRTLVWDVQASSGATVKTLADGLLFVLPDVTRATS